MEPQNSRQLLQMVVGTVITATITVIITDIFAPTLVPYLKDKLNFSTSTNTPEESDTSPHWMNYRLLETELSQKSERELNLIRNEIFARHGYIFEDSEYRDYFNNKSWYSPKYTCKEFSDIYPLTDVQDYNADLIRRHQCERGHSSCDDNPPC
jgi:hypothetical protein